MATQRLYYDDSYLQNFDARLEECVSAGPLATGSGTVAVWEVVLDRTAFYPTSGGQPNDVGKIGDARVLDVRDEGYEIVHIVDRDLERGAVHGCIDWERRFDHMQQHTGQHLLSAVFQERYGLPTVSFHLGSDLCTIDLRGPEPTAEVLQGAQKAANAIVFEDRPVNVRYGTAAQFAEQGVRKEVDREGILRGVEIERADLQPCGGTHVKSTGHIGLILIRRCTKTRQDWRVEFVCGGRSARVATNDFHVLRTVGERLSCAPEESVAAINKVTAERDAQFKSLRAALQQLAEARAKLMIAGSRTAETNGRRVIAEVLQDENPELLLLLATELAKNEGTVAILVHAPTGQLVFAQHPSVANDLASLLRTVLATVPGKGGGTRDFVRAKLAEPARSAEALGTATALLSQPKRQSLEAH
jgi:alanyl-tRNA synthetase